MSRGKKLTYLLLVVLLGLGVALVGCAPEEEPPVEEPEVEEPEEPVDVDEVDIGYVMWACAEAATHVTTVVIEDELGYDVNPISLEVGGMYSGLADGDIDAMACAWLPVTHEEYMDTYGADVVDLGPNYEGARIGLVVPDYVEVDSIEELNDYADDFDGEITGIDAGAGIMMATEEAIEEYGLELELIESSDVAMAAALADAVLAEEWIVVTGWTPHWKFAEYELKFLEDPQGVYGDVEDIHTLTRQNLEEDIPDLYSFLDNFYMTDDDMGFVMELIEEGEDPMDAARQWVEENPDVVEGWLQ